MGKAIAAGQETKPEDASTIIVMSQKGGTGGSPPSQPGSPSRAWPPRRDHPDRTASGGDRDPGRHDPGGKVAGAPAAVVITRAERGHPHINHAKKYIRTLDALLCPIVIHKHLIHATAYRRGRTAREQRPTSEAGLEMLQLEKWITKTYA